MPVHQKYVCTTVTFCVAFEIIGLEILLKPGKHTLCPIQLNKSISKTAQSKLLDCMLDYFFKLSTA